MCIQGDPIRQPMSEDEIRWAMSRCRIGAESVSLPADHDPGIAQELHQVDAEESVREVSLLLFLKYFNLCHSLSTCA
jgi:hypothetical protein